MLGKRIPLYSYDLGMRLFDHQSYEFSGGVWILRACSPNLANYTMQEKLSNLEFSTHQKSRNITIESIESNLIGLLRGGFQGEGVP